MAVDGGGGGGRGVRVHTDCYGWWVWLIEGYRNVNGEKWSGFKGSVKRLIGTLWEGNFHRQRKKKKTE
jgi:hypothetical protein